MNKPRGADKFNPSLPAPVAKPAAQTPASGIPAADRRTFFRNAKIPALPEQGFGNILARRGQNLVLSNRNQKPKPNRFPLATI